MWIKRLGTATCILTTILFYSSASVADTPSCSASKDWITSPNPPSEVPNGKSADFCDFYKFSWQWFFYLTSKPEGHSERRFQMAEQFPILEGSNKDSCDNKAPKHEFFVRTTKESKPDGSFVLPERIHQAGRDRATIYDQQGNVVFYGTRFSRNLCNVGKIQSQAQYPSGTTELKTAWRVIKSHQTDRYFSMEADIEGLKGKQLLGLIGFHLVRATDRHPEFIWSTFEHRDNAPDCTNPQSTPEPGWSFTSAQCAKDLASGNKDKCSFNKANSSKSLTGKPTQICRLYRDGTKMGDHKSKINSQVVDSLNKQLHKMLSQLDKDHSMSIWKHYMNVGALWENDTSKPSSVTKNQRGSMRLANTVMETTFQDVHLNKGFSSNCFGCHSYKGNQVNTSPYASLSHSFDDIIEGQCNPTDVKAGPIWSKTDAVSKCAETCKDKGGWNGQWRTTKPGQMSVCACCDVK